MRKVYIKDKILKILGRNMVVMKTKKYYANQYIYFRRNVVQSIWINRINESRKICDDV